MEMNPFRTIRLQVSRYLCFFFCIHQSLNIKQIVFKCVVFFRHSKTKSDNNLSKMQNIVLIILAEIKQIIDKIKLQFNYYINFANELAVLFEIGLLFI